MFVACTVVTAALAVAVTASAARKLSRAPQVVADYARVGVPEAQLPALAALLLAAGIGLLTGLGWAPLGIATSACLVAYFLLAVAAHVRRDDVEHVAPPIVLLAASIAALVLRSLTT